jgi:hypothetical protein
MNSLPPPSAMMKHSKSRTPSRKKKKSFPLSWNPVSRSAHIEEKIAAYASLAIKVLQIHQIAQRVSENWERTFHDLKLGAD